MATLTHQRETERRIASLKRMDPWLIGSTVFLIAVGLLSLYSVNSVNPSSNYFRSQILHIAIGFIPFCAFLFIDPNVWKRYATVLYIVNVLLLVLVLRMGHSSGGAQRWLQFGKLEFQPSELAKLLVILTLASFLASRLDQIRKFSTFFLSLLHVAVPLFLIYKQPHLGATLVILIAWLSVTMAAGVRMRFLLGTILLIVCGLTVAMKVPGVLQNYQRERVRAMLNPNSEGNAYQPERAEIAFGVGGLTGTGFLHGDQKKSHYIPEQQTDFIITVVGEEGGLIACTLVLIAYGILFFRIWLQMVRSEEPFHRMIAAGIFGILAFHTVVNLGMCLQLLPVVGLWLPFMSYGGSAMWLCMSCIGLLLNLQARQRPKLF